MSKLLPAILLALGTTAASADTAIVDTFNEADQANLFDCCNTLPIAGVHARSPQSSVAVPFTPETYAKIIEVDVALSGGQFYTDQLKVEIAGSTMGLPGKVKKSWTGQPPAGGQCCQYVARRPGNPVPAAAGGHYWIVVEGIHGAIGAWNLNSMGASGPYAVMGEDKVWTITEGPLPAVRVIAK